MVEIFGLISGRIGRKQAVFANVWVTLPTVSAPYGVPPRHQAVKLYYVVLESILASEERTTGSALFPTLLASAKFHTAMLACSCEVRAGCLARSHGWACWQCTPASGYQTAPSYSLACSQK